MNIFQVIKGTKQVIKDNPKIKDSLREIKDSLREISDINRTTVAELEELKEKLKNDFQNMWPSSSIPLPLHTETTISSICKQADFLKFHHEKWCRIMREEPRFHRKQWEFVYILESLHQRGMIEPGKKGLGFAVGTEPLPSVFTSFGCEIVATDINPEQGTEKGWTTGDQLCFGIDDLNKNNICPDASFKQLCTYRAVDMNHIPEDLHDFDFNWSSCSFEHLGSIEKGLDFVKNQLKTLKPGGWAVHTTEYNLSSNDETLEDPNCVAFRQRDIEKVIAELRADGHHVADVDYSIGWLPFDYKVDLPPFKQSPHLRLKLDQFVCTSIGLIIQKKPD